MAVGYGGRREIADAVRSLLHEHAAAGGTLEELAEILDVEHIAEHLYTRGQPDPDLVIRTSGEQRLSGFLLWQSAHSEFYFHDANWPDFRRIDFLRALRSYAQPAAPLRRLSGSGQIGSVADQDWSKERRPSARNAATASGESSVRSAALDTSAPVSGFATATHMPKKSGSTASRARSASNALMSLMSSPKYQAQPAVVTPSLITMPLSWSTGGFSSTTMRPPWIRSPSRSACS